MSIFTKLTKSIAGGVHPHTGPARETKSSLRDDTVSQLRFFATLKGLDIEEYTEQELLQKWHDLSEDEKADIAGKWHVILDTQGTQSYEDY